jgi:hypothetical protein
MIIKLASHTMDHARRELDAIGMTSDNKEPMNREARKNVLDLLRVFSKQGHSGCSAPYIADLFNKLVRHKPLSPLTGEDKEWHDTSDMCPTRKGEPVTYQNIRASNVFKKGRKVYQSDGLMFEDPTGATFTSSRFSHVPIEKFPYTPKQKVIKDKGYGFCDKCGQPGTSREKKSDGKCFCENGHSYKWENR